MLDSSGHTRSPAARAGRSGLADEVAFRIQTDILDGRYPPGAHLQQEALCADLGVSRTPVREALRKLEAQSLVVLTPNKGARVRRPTRRELGESYAVRAELEGFASALAAERMDIDATVALDRALAGLEVVVASLERGVGDEQAARLHVRVALDDEDFHATIHATAGNEQLRSLLEELRRHVPKDYVWRATHSADQARRLNLDDHRAIRDALCAQDAERAREAMRRHILHAGELLLDYFDARGFWDTGPAVDSSAQG